MLVDAQPTLAFYATHSLTGYSCVVKADPTGPSGSLLEYVLVCAEEFGSQRGLTISMQDPHNLKSVMAASPSEVLPSYTSSMRAIRAHGFAAPVSLQMGQSQTLVAFIWHMLAAVDTAASKSQRERMLQASTMEQDLNRRYSTPPPGTTPDSKLAGNQPSALDTKADSSVGGREGVESPLAGKCEQVQHELRLPGSAKHAIHCFHTLLLLLKLASLCQLDGSEGIPPQPQQLFWNLARSMTATVLHAFWKLSAHVKEHGLSKELGKVQEDVQMFSLSAAPVLVQSFRNAVQGLHGDAPTTTHLLAALTCLSIIDTVVGSDMEGARRAFCEELFKLGGFKLRIAIRMHACFSCMPAQSPLLVIGHASLCHSPQFAADQPDDSLICLWAVPSAG